MADRPDDVLVAVPYRGNLGKGTIELKDVKTADPHKLAALKALAD